MTPPTGARAVPPPDDIERLLARAREGDAEALGALMPLVYDELRRIAARHMRRARPGQTIQTTALVHEAYLRLLKDRSRPWQDRAQFLGIAASAMRRILVERARARGAAKRGGPRERISLDEGRLAAPAEAIDVSALDEALQSLARLAPRQARIVELRYFGGLTVEETARVLDISPATLKRDWTVARAWLRRALEKP